MQPESSFSRFEAISFDCYGTLIDWETGILGVLRDWSRRRGVEVADARLLELFGAHERRVQREMPATLYPDVLAEVHRRIASELEAECNDADAAALGASVGDWPVFPDTADALRRLGAVFKIFVLSNVDRDSFARSRAAIGVAFDGIVTAEDVGSYKPDRANFAALKDCVAAAGVESSALLHVGESLFHDVAPGNEAGLATVWIDRRTGAPERFRASGALDLASKPTMTFDSMRSFALAACDGPPIPSRSG